MLTANADWRVDLINARHGLFNPPPGAPEAARGYLDCGDGWRQLLERTFAKIETALVEGGVRFRSLQIKERHGTLRLDCDFDLSDQAEAAVQEAIYIAEARTAVSCDQCGDEGRCNRTGGVLMTRCTAHAKGQPVAIKRGLENIHLVQQIVEDGTIERCEVRKRHLENARFTRTSFGFESWP